MGTAKPTQGTMAMTGAPGLDDIMCGGFAPGRVYLLEGSPGTGKTTTAIRFLLTGADAGERGLYIMLAETGYHAMRPNSARGNSRRWSAPTSKPAASRPSSSTV